MDKKQIISLLQDQKNQLSKTTLKQLFAEDKKRVEKMSILTDNFLFDFSKNIIDQHSLHLLLQLANSLDLKSEIEAMFSGQKINKTEERAVLHTALRSANQEPLVIDGQDIRLLIAEEKQKLADFADKIYNQKFTINNHKINTIVNIGIGGSDLGPKMARQALRVYQNKDIKVHFVSNVDPADIEEVLKQVDARKTIFIIASKTFTTQETILNASIAKNWLKQELGADYNFSQHLVALSSNDHQAIEFGVKSDQIFHFWDWVGGRYSLPSAIGLSLMIAIGSLNFDKLLQGMESIDEHLRSAPFMNNVPVLMALIGFWYNNIWQYSSLAVLPYSSDLGLFPDYLQQLEMESNGKNIDRQSQPTSYNTVPVLWGAAGSDAQHSFFQMLHQGTRIIPTDFIGFCCTNRANKNSHKILMANFFAQQQALAFGKSKQQVMLELKRVPQADFIANYKTFAGNRPSSCLLFEELSPYTLGQLIAIYEHKVFIQGILWNIFSFDQWGVELGKSLAKELEKHLSKAELLTKFDSSTNLQINYFNKFLGDD